VSAGSRAAADGADLPHGATLAALRAGRLIRLAFRPGPAVSTLDSARRVKSGLARSRQRAGSGLTGRRERSAAVAPGAAGSRAQDRADSLAVIGRGPAGLPVRQAENDEIQAAAPAAQAPVASGPDQRCACRVLRWHATHTAGLPASPPAQVPGPGITGGRYRGSR